MEQVECGALSGGLPRFATSDSSASASRRSEQLGLLLENRLESAGFSGDGTNNDQGFRGPGVPCFYPLTTTTYDTSRSNTKPIE